MLFSNGKFVATEPMGDQSNKARVSNGFAAMETRLTLKALRVVFNSTEADLFAGDTIYVPADAGNTHSWAKKVYTLNGQDFIMVPEEFVVVVDVDPDLRETAPLPN